MSEDLKIVASLSSEPEADVAIARLMEAGIHALAQRSIGGPEWGFSGARDVYVKANDLDRAREILKSDENAFSDEELTRLSEQAGREATEQP